MGQAFIPRVGLLLYGFCNGYFGRDSYETKCIEALGADWVVCRDDKGQSVFTAFDSTTEMNTCIESWSSEKEKESWGI